MHLSSNDITKMSTFLLTCSIIISQFFKPRVCQESHFDAVIPIFIALRNRKKETKYNRESHILHAICDQETKTLFFLIQKQMNYTSE